MAKTQVTVFGAAWCPDCKGLKHVLASYEVPYRWVDIDDDPAAAKLVASIGSGTFTIPVVELANGERLVQPKIAELQVALGIKHRASKPSYDVIIVGGGPAGLTAAIYTGRAGFSTLIMDRAGVGGQAAITQVLDNFPGFDEGISGAEFADRLSRQAQKFGAEMVQGKEIANISRDGQYLLVTSVNKRQYVARAVLVATGSRYRTLGVPGEQELIGMRIQFLRHLRRAVISRQAGVGGGCR